MAKYVVTHSCGHTEEVSLFGSVSERESRIAWLEGQPCTECRAREATGLTGSPKQRAWAADIREEAKAQIARGTEKYLELVGCAKSLLACEADMDFPGWVLEVLGKVETGEAVERIEALNTLYDGIIAAHTDARWWIDHRDNPLGALWDEAKKTQPDVREITDIDTGLRVVKAQVEHATVASN